MPEPRPPRIFAGTPFSRVFVRPDRSVVPSKVPMASRLTSARAGATAATDNSKAALNGVEIRMIYPLPCRIAEGGDLRSRHDGEMTVRDKMKRVSGRRQRRPDVGRAEIS